MASPFDRLALGFNRAKLATAPDPSYLQKGVAILELATRAAELFEKQSEEIISKLVEAEDYRSRKPNWKRALIGMHASRDF